MDWLALIRLIGVKRVLAEQVSRGRRGDGALE